MGEATRVAGSFRDRDGFVFKQDGGIFRQVSESFLPTLEKLLASPLYAKLVQNGSIVSVEPVDGDASVLRAQVVPFISYPYEWCFGQLKAAALLTLQIAAESIQHGFSLKDASAYNVQFLGTRPIFIDSLSFEQYVEGEPWIAYRQFCQHFLAPLALMSHVDVRLGQLMRTYIDGIPLDLASKLLPGMTKMNPGMLMHIHAHAKVERSSGTKSASKAHVGRTAVLGLLDNLKSTVERMNYEPSGTEWANYYEETNYSDSARDRKGELVKSMLQLVELKAGTAWDLGANDATYSRIAAELGMQVVAWDIDPAAVERSFRAARPNILPLLQDFSNNSPNLGWLSTERDGFFARGPADVALALALIHHLAIGNNVPLDSIAEFFARSGEWVLVEWVPKTDSQVQRMMVARKDIFDDYTEDGFVAAMKTRFDVVSKAPIAESARTLFLFRRR